MIAAGTVKSKKPISSPALRATPAPRRLVEVPISVVMPPRSAAKLSGIRAFDVGTPRVAAMAVMIGRNITTTGVSLTTELTTMAAAMTRMTAPMPDRPPRRASIAAGRSRESVWYNPWPTTIIASTVISASFEKPARMSSGPSGLLIPRIFGTSVKSTSQAIIDAMEITSIAQRSRA